MQFLFLTANYGSTALGLSGFILTYPVTPKVSEMIGVTRHWIFQMSALQVAQCSRISAFN